ncbi:MAG: hypothetical protein G01um101416_1246, partial [Microgenomates group bacterium Gr01-1014_16]
RPREFLLRNSFGYKRRITELNNHFYQRKMSIKPKSTINSPTLCCLLNLTPKLLFLISFHKIISASVARLLKSLRLSLILLTSPVYFSRTNYVISSDSPLLFKGEGSRVRIKGTKTTLSPQTSSLFSHPPQPPP